MEMWLQDILENESAPWINQLTPDQALYLARAAIAAMREPTMAMLEAGLIRREYAVGDEYCANRWQAMIDAASPP